MLFRINQSYKSSLTAEQIYHFLENLSSKKSGVWLLKGESYDIHVGGPAFSIKKHGGGANGPIYPLIKGKIIPGDFVQIHLDIKPAYYTILFSTIVGLILLLSALLSEKITVNGVYRSVTLLERAGMAVFVIAVPAIISYFKTIKPVQDAEKWLIKEMKLEPTGD